MAHDEEREELARVAASLRAYLEWQAETGALGVPRLPRTGPRAVERLETRAVPHGEPARAAAVPEPEVPVAAGALRPAPPAVPPARREDMLTIAAEPAARKKPQGSPEEKLARLPQLREEVAACTRCGLAATRTQTVFARGNPRANLCFVGEAPGADEDAQGLPFVGRAGQLLDRMIGAMGLDPAADVYVCNILKCRPPDNRRPEPAEMDACFPYLHEQLALVGPKVIVALGNTAVQALLGTKLGITKVRGSWKLYKGSTLVMPTYHPSYLLRPSAQQAEAKRQAWEDLQAVMKELKIPLPPKRES